MKDVLEDKVLTLKQVGYLIAGVIVATFTVTMIYATFVTMGHDMDALKHELEAEIQQNSERIEYVNDRIDRKTNGVKDDLELELGIVEEEVKSHEKRLDQLEKPNSDH